MANPTYTIKPSPAVTALNRRSVSDFGGVAIDGNQNTISGSGNGVVFQDAADVKSPLTLTSDYQKITIPTNATQITFAGTATAATDAKGENGEYDIDNESLDCARMGEIYVKGSGNLGFMFTLV